MSKVGIITMHRPISYGSALQTYATMRSIELMGHSAEIIDYQYPNEFHFKNKGISVSKIKSFVANLLMGFPNLKKLRKFNKFHKSYFKLSKYYPTEHSLAVEPPLYDIYVTGSDQVWNTRFVKNDSSFLLSFAPKNAKKIAFSSSFAHSTFDNNYKELFKKYLIRYNHISVRESSGIDIVKELTGQEAFLVCDPTLLLGKAEWDKVESNSKLTVKAPYILVFLLCYSFNPYPQVKNIIRSIQNQLNLRVVYLDGIKDNYFSHNSQVIKNAGPEDFLRLIKNAKYVITDSFHGTIFSTLYKTPFTSIVNPNNTDSRVLSFLYKIKGESNALAYDSKDVIINQSLELVELEKFVKESRNRLSHFINE